jgi:hypothetical protein
MRCDAPADTCIITETMIIEVEGCVGVMSVGVNPIQSFEETYYKPKFATHLEKLLAVADSIHDFGKGYRNNPSSAGKVESDKFLRNNLSNLLRANPDISVIQRGYNNIEAANKEFFEYQASVPWISPITVVVSVDDITRDNSDPVSEAIAFRANNISIEIEPSRTRSIVKLPPDALKKLHDFIITFLFGEATVTCYFASDAQPKSVGKILERSEVARGIIFPRPFLILLQQLSAVILQPSQIITTSPAT